MRKSKWTAGAVMGAMLLTMTAALLAPVTAEAADLRLRTRLTGPAIAGVTPHGVAKYRERGAKRKFATEVQDVNLPDGTVLHVRVNSTEVGTLTLSLQRGQLELRTRDGDTVPVIVKGDVVTVVDAGNITIVSGTF